MNLDQGMSENPQGSASQPTELSSPVNVQDLQPEPEGQDNPELEPEEGDRPDSVHEGVGHSDDERENEVGPPPKPNMSSQDDILQDFGAGMAQVLANMNVYMQLEELLNPNLGETQSPRNFGYSRILPCPKYRNQQEEVDTEVIRESDNQSGDTVLLEQRQDEQPSSLETEVINKTISKLVTPQKRRGTRMKLKKLRKEHQKFCKMVKRL